MKLRHVATFALLLACCVACSSPPTGSALPTPTPNPATSDALPPLDASSVVPYVVGYSDSLGAADFVPMMSEGEGYAEKWELMLYTKPYEARVKFEVSNLGFGDFKGKVSGRVKLRVDGQDLETYPISDSFGSGSWSRDEQGFGITMGDWRVAGTPGALELTGVAGDRGQVSFRFSIGGAAWRPGSGVAFFGADYQNYLKTQTLVFHGACNGELVIDGERHELSGHAYGNHLASNIPMHEMADSYYHFRKYDEDLYIEWRHFVTTQPYRHQPLGFLVVAYKGTVVFESTEVELVPQGYWTDPGNFGYSIPHGITLRARDGEASAVLSFGAGEVEASDPLANLSSIERNIALQYTQPTDYKVPGPWRLDLDSAGFSATLRDEGSYSITVLR